MREHAGWAAAVALAALAPLLPWLGLSPPWESLAALPLPLVLAALWRAQRRRQRDGEAALSAAQQQAAQGAGALQQFRAATQHEMEGVLLELDRVRSLVEDATRQLHVAFEALHGQVQAQQGAALRVLETAQGPGAGTAGLAGVLGALQQLQQRLQGPVAGAAAAPEIAELQTRLAALNHSLLTELQGLRGGREQMNASVAQAVRCLQFEDIAAQALAAAQAHLARLAHASEDGASHRAGASAARPLHKPVSQQTMDPGSVELF